MYAPASFASSERTYENSQGQSHSKSGTSLFTPSGQIAEHPLLTHVSQGTLNASKPPHKRHRTKGAYFTVAAQLQPTQNPKLDIEL